MTDNIATTMIKIILFNIIAVSLVAFISIDGAPTDSKTDPSYWLQRKSEFYKNTTFPLSAANQRLFGGKYSPYHTGHLPFWFDFELYKTVYGKQYADPDENLARHHLYIKRCVRVLKLRVLFRILAGSQDAVINWESDQFHDENRPRKEANAAADQSEEVKFMVSFELDENFSREGESPLAKAVRLVREELDQVESRNQVDNYLKAFNEEDGSAIAAKLPY